MNLFCSLGRGGYSIGGANLKRLNLVFGSIIFFVLAAAVLASSFTMFNNNPTLTGNINSQLNGSFIVTNTGSDQLTLSSIDFRNFLNSKFTFPTSAFGHNGNSLIVPIGQTRTINYTVSLANNPYAATYNGQINVTAFNSTGAFLDNAAALSVVVLPKKNATASVSTATVVQGQTGGATISVNNIGNTDLSFTSFLPGVIFNSTGWPLTSSIVYPANIDTAYGGSNSTGFNMTLLPAATPGTYYYNVTISDGAGLTMIAPATLIVQAITQSTSSSSSNGQLKMDMSNSNFVSQTPVSIIVTNNGNVDDSVSLTITNLVHTTNSTNVIPSSTLLYNPASTVSLGKNGGSKQINVTTSLGGGISLGQYRGNLTVIYGNCNGCTQRTINSTVLVDVVQAQAVLSVPAVTLSGSRNSTVNGSFEVRNTGDFPLTIQSITTTADSKYNVTFNVVGNNFNIPIGSNAIINVSGFIPATQSSGLVRIGSVNVQTDRTTSSADLSLNTQSALVFSDMDVKSSESSTHFRLNDQGSSVEIKPGSTVTVKPTVLNNFTGSMRIEEITVTAKIIDINRLNDDNDASLELDTSEFNLNAQSAKTSTFDFTVPLRVEEKNYTLEVTAEGYDDLNARHSATWTMSLDLQKDDDSVTTQLSMSPSDVLCGQPATLEAELTNTGSDDQDVSVSILGPAFGITQYYSNVTLSGDARDDSSVYSIEHSFVVIDGLNATTYPITVESRYSDKTDRAIINVPVSGSRCTGQPEEPPIVVPPNQGGQTVATIPGSFLDSGTLWYKQPWYLALLIAANVLLVIVIISLIMTAVRRRR